MVYFKIDKRAHLYFSIERVLSLWCMILGQQNRRRIPLARERQGFPYSRTPFPRPLHICNVITHALLDDRACVNNISALEVDRM